MDEDTPQTIEWTVKQMLANQVEILVPWMLTPIPGTPCYDDYKSQKRLIHENYSLYDCWHPVIKPKQISPSELEKCFWLGLKHFYKRRFILQRIWKKKDGKIPAFFYNLYFRHQIHNGLHPFSGSA